MWGCGRGRRGGAGGVVSALRPWCPSAGLQVRLKARQDKQEDFARRQNVLSVFISEKNNLASAKK